MFSSLPFGFMFIFTMVFGTLFSISSVHWLGIWAGLEINLIGFLPLLVYQKSMSESESAVKYFIIQALGSSFLIFGSLSMCSLTFSWDFFNIFDFSMLSYLILTFGLIIKMGMFPFHFWLPGVMAGLPWISCLLLATWQKVAPIFLIGSFFSLYPLYCVLLICIFASGSSVVGGLGGLNQTQVRAILAYSSIGHLGWILFALIHSEWAMKIYFMIYILISVGIFISLWYLDMKFLKVLNNLTFNSYYTLLVMLMFLSLGGLPPMLGFISKWVVVYSTMMSPYSLFLWILILGSMMSLFYYLSLYFSIFMSSFKLMNLNINKLFLKNNLITLVLFTNLLGGLLLFFISGVMEF